MFMNMTKWVECSPMVRETWVQSQVGSYQRFSKWYFIPPCLTLSSIRYVSRVKWSNLEKGVAPFPTTWCSSYGKGSFRVAIDYGRQLYLLTMSISHIRISGYVTTVVSETSLLLLHAAVRYKAHLNWTLYTTEYMSRLISIHSTTRSSHCLSIYLCKILKKEITKQKLLLLWLRANEKLTF